MTLLPLAQNLFTLVGMLAIVYRLDPQLALLSLTVVPVLYYSIGYYVTHVQTRLHEVRGLEGGAMGIIHESLAMLRVIVAFGREEHEYRRMREQGERANEARVALTLRQTLFSLCVDLTTSAGTALVLGVGAYHVFQRRLTVGDLLIVMSYIGSVYKPLEAISSTIGGLQMQLSQLSMAFNVLDIEPDIQDRPGAVNIGRAEGRVTFEQVAFSYKTRTDTLTDLSFEAAPGGVIAVVGPTGAGKTTLISLIPRFYDPSAGRILLDGRDIRDISLKSLREQISLVLQEPLLFSGTIQNNIRYGRLDATDEEIIEAAKAANAHDFIMNLPKQYETEIGERGSQLSGGERQRVSVARAFLKDAPILILDEPTSSIDSKTEAVILDALERLIAGRTTFMVAHRLSTLRHADQILVMDHGRLVEHGTHDELMALSGLYRQLNDLQSGRTRRKVQEAVRATMPAAAERMS
jgi:ABC-type multidrug transport system fused ATPase/permease subunit